jgi:hypothetical protein
MARGLSGLFASIAQAASYSNEPVLAYLCQMAAMEAENTTVPSALCKQIVEVWMADCQRDDQRAQTTLARIDQRA